MTGIEPALSAWEAVPSGPVTWPDLRGGVSASDRERPLVTGVNGPLMARRSPGMTCARRVETNLGGCSKPNRISSSGRGCPDRFKLDQSSRAVPTERCRTVSNCNPNCNPVPRRDPLLRRSVCAAGQPARPQVSQPIGLSGSDREFPVLTGRSGTQRARRIRSGP